MHLLIYTSLSTASHSQLLLDVESIVKASRRNNARHGITGAFFRCDNRFLQFLEGEADAVHGLFERISADPRHTNLEVLVNRAVRQRAFSRWSMDYYGIPHDMLLDDDALSRIADAYQRDGRRDHERDLSAVISDLVEQANGVILSA